MNLEKASEVLKNHSLTDDQILDLATVETLGEGVRLLRSILSIPIDTLWAMRLIKELKKELE